MANKKNRDNLRSKKGSGYLQEDDQRNVSNADRSGKIGNEEKTKGSKNWQSDMDDDHRNKSRGGSERTER